MCGHSGGGKLFWGGVRNFEAVLGRGFETVIQGFCFVLNIYLTISFTSFFGLVSFSNKTTLVSCFNWLKLGSLLKERMEQTKENTPVHHLDPTLLIFFHISASYKSCTGYFVFVSKPKNETLEELSVRILKKRRATAQQFFASKKWRHITAREHTEKSLEASK